MVIKRIFMSVSSFIVIVHINANGRPHRVVPSKPPKRGKTTHSGSDLRKQQTFSRRITSSLFTVQQRVSP
jgi:hypothetical protein